MRKPARARPEAPIAEAPETPETPPGAGLGVGLTGERPTAEPPLPPPEGGPPVGAPPARATLALEKSTDGAEAGR